MLPVYGKLVPEEGMWVFKRLLWRKFKLFLLQHLFLENVNLFVQWYPFESQLLKGCHCFSLFFKANSQIKLGCVGGGER